MFGTNFSKTKGKIVTKLKERFIEQNRKLDELEEQVSFQESIINHLWLECHEEQYSRRNCSRIHGIDSKKNEKIDNVWQKVKECYEPVQVQCPEESIALIELEWSTRIKNRKESIIHHSEIQVTESVQVIFYLGWFNKKTLLAIAWS